MIIGMCMYTVVETAENPFSSLVSEISDTTGVKCRGENQNSANVILPLIQLVTLPLSFSVNIQRRELSSGNSFIFLVVNRRVQELQAKGNKLNEIQIVIIPLTRIGHKLAHSSDFLGLEVWREKASNLVQSVLVDMNQ